MTFVKNTPLILVDWSEDWTPPWSSVRKRSDSNN